MATKEEDQTVGLMPKCRLLCQGAEGRVFETKYWKKKAILKQRFDKMYRHPILNKKLTRQRLGMEVRGMMKARKLGIKTPTVLLVDQETNSIVMEKMPGIMVKDWLKAGKYSEADLDTVLATIGKMVANLHDGSLIHGDLTTSNMIIRTESLDITFIDFGLSFNCSAQNGPEDKGVDLYVMERAFLNAHADLPGLFEKVLGAYEGETSLWKSTFNRYSEVRMRGRKRSMVG
ncbi:serine/threonine-protein kinase [Chloropicon primus]|uniref:non-specific serine/threonine protein kinase n=1 Tax=Chloropicon primus TaxID=1764295 RepID=A0A5B8MV22_9CHLO|nr:serine/threonine-protein kinase [Chloropicon primus]UPR02697.1 serine/threonine-protein kinase [Chloropicon primus]|eukprot:QDZ23485.1 serine/threonine-protein kinase [Chloropicon primus]